MSTFVPCDIGLPSHFTDWRPRQLDAVNFIADTDKRFIATCAPTGFGKSLMYMAAAYLSGMRTVVLTSTKGLQDQIARDFETISTDIRGMQNYVCSQATRYGMSPKTRVSDGPCHHGAGCSLKSGGCEYFDLYRLAQKADIVVTNYQCWLYDRLKGQRKDGNLTTDRPVDMLILDECFPAGTLVDGRPIEQIKLGDEVTCFSANRIGKSRVVRLFKRPAPKRMLRLHFDCGISVTCTLEHPFYTRQGYVPAYRLILGDMPCIMLGRSYEHSKGVQVRPEKSEVPAGSRDLLSLVQKGHFRPWFGGVCDIQSAWKSSLLLERMRTAVPHIRIQKESIGRLGAEDALGSHVEAQSHEVGQGQSQGANNAAGNGLEADSPRGKWPGAVHLSEIVSYDFGLADGSPNSIGYDEETVKEAIFADVLQGRYSGMFFASCSRSGREQPQPEIAPEIRCQEGTSAYWTRVEGFEVYEQTDREGLGELCPDGYVYNLEVEGAHTYTANGMIVHNCHDAVEELSSFLAVELERKDCLSLGVTWPRSGYTQTEWRDWASHWEQTLDHRLDDLKEQMGSSGWSSSLMHEIKVTKELQRKIERVALMQDEWVIEEFERTGDEARRVKFDPLWPRLYAERSLFRGIGKIVLVSATVREKTAELLGVPSDQLAFQEFPSSFPVANRPVIHVPTVRMNYRNEQDDNQMMWFLRKLDLLLDRRGDRKGVIHSVSYKRARFIMDNSKHASKMMIHGSDTRALTIDRFIRARPESGAILVSPSVDTGYDFAGELAEYQIICKLPFPDTRGTVMKARCQQDKDYSAYLTAMVIQQMTGRVCRSETDRGETLITDDNCVWMVPKFRRYFNRWWLHSYRSQPQGRLPEPLEKL